MLKAVWLSLLWRLLYVIAVDGIIEIVEEQKCHNERFRLTCRELDTRLAVLEAWYTTLEDHATNHTETSRTPQPLVHTENDSELDHVYTYSSPQHNGFYQLVNSTSAANFDNLTFVTMNEVNDSDVTVNDTFVEMSGGECGVPGFMRSYASWREGDKKKMAVVRKESINLRSPVSYRCTGLNHCSFILGMDYPPSLKWSDGVVYIKYACFDETASIHHCNRLVDIHATGPDSEGYIRTPGYPHYYIGGECRWRLRAALEQKIRITLLDISLRSIGPFEEECADYVMIQDANGQLLFSSCEQVPLPVRITSETNELDLIVQVRSEGAFPKRGMLIHYKSVGCVTIPPPSDGYLVYRNEDVAHYMCNEDRVFVDTRQRARLIWCYDDNRWNDSVPLCAEVSSLDAEDSTSGTVTGTNVAHSDANMLVDIVIPSLLIAALFIGNAFIVLIIYKYRKRKNDDCDDEFNTIPLSANGNAHSAGNAV